MEQENLTEKALEEAITSLSVTQLARALNLKIDTVYKRIKRGVVPIIPGLTPYRIPALWVVRSLREAGVLREGENLQDLVAMMAPKPKPAPKPAPKADPVPAEPAGPAEEEKDYDWTK